MAKAAGAFLTAEARLASAAGSRNLAHAAELASLAEGAEGHAGQGCWGYEFDVQTRWAFYPAGSPNLIATFFVGRGFAEAGVAFGRRDWVDEANLASEYLASGLLAVRPDNRLYFTYVPGNGTLVHNANLLGAGLVAALGMVGNRPDDVATAVAAARTSISAQSSRGGWPYGEAPGLAWEDSFHTAYNLDGLLLVWLASADDAVRQALVRGVTQWRERFFGDAGEPYYTPGRGPFDIHAAATAVDVAARLASWGFEDTGLAHRVREWTERNLVDRRTGATYYQRGRVCVDKRHFVRWGDAHWALGTSSIALLEAGVKSPFEVAVTRARQRRQMPGSDSE